MTTLPCVNDSTDNVKTPTAAKGRVFVFATSRTAKKDRHLRPEPSRGNRLMVLGEGGAARNESKLSPSKGL